MAISGDRVQMPVGFALWYYFLVRVLACLLLLTRMSLLLAITAAHRFVNRQAKVKELLLRCCRQGSLQFATLSSQYHEACDMERSVMQ